MHTLDLAICRKSFKSIGKPNSLKQNLAGYGSQQTDETRRLLQRIRILKSSPVVL
ncbi:type II toxin-antitoxin system YoeB family toxin [Faucicola atlantae]|uniref:type II toxin-antitoxin system YoeB family toxin n=1 Tax=Faucicola atlantae TaxID=34059 RepID=UPI0009F4B12D